MERILFIASQPFFEWRGSPIRLGFDLLALTEMGYSVDFLTLPLGERREIPGVRIIRAPNLFGARGIAIGPSLLKLAFDGLLFWMALGCVVRRRYAVVHGVEDCGIIAWCAARVGRAGTPGLRAPFRPVELPQGRGAQRRHAGLCGRRALRDAPGGRRHRHRPRPGGPRAVGRAREPRLPDSGHSLLAGRGHPRRARGGGARAAHVSRTTC